MPQKAYKRRPPRKSQPAVNGGFSLPREATRPYDPITVKDPENPDIKFGRVSARQEVETLAMALRAPIMHIVFVDRRSGAWMRIDWPED